MPLFPPLKATISWNVVLLVSTSFLSVYAALLHLYVLLRSVALILVVFDFIKGVSALCGLFGLFSLTYATLRARYFRSLQMDRFLLPSSISLCEYTIVCPSAVQLVASYLGCFQGFAFENRAGFCVLISYSVTLITTHLTFQNL